VTPLSSRLLRAPANAVSDLAGGLLALAFGGVAMLRGERPLHPDGVTYTASVTSRGNGRSGVPWLDERGTTQVTLRVSRAIGLPARLADIYGIALRIPLPRRDPPSTPWADLLFATTGDTAFGRYVLRPRRGSARGPLTTLLPVRAPAGPMLLRLMPTVGASIPGDDLSLPSELTLSYAVWSRPWTDVADLVVGTREPAGPALERHDPITAELPGTQQYEPVRRLREPAYRAARWVRPHG
jgi:hypothetical protein